MKRYGLLLCVLMLALAGCGGGGGNGVGVAMPDAIVEQPEPEPERQPGPEPEPEPRADLDELLQDLQVTPAETRAERILEQADTVLIPGVYASGTITAQGITESFTVFEPKKQRLCLTGHGFC